MGVGLSVSGPKAACTIQGTREEMLCEIVKLEPSVTNSQSPDRSWPRRYIPLRDGSLPEEHVRSQSDGDLDPE